MQKNRKAVAIHMGKLEGNKSRRFRDWTVTRENVPVSIVNDYDYD